MEKWKIWIPDIETPKFMYSKSCYITEKGLILGYKDNNARKITISFLDGYLSNRETDEGGIYDTLCDIYAYSNEKKWKSANFLTVENSNYVRWFKEQNLDGYKDTKIEHYIIIAYDIISEVLSTAAPKIEVSE
jgi:hypothetical protein